MNSKTIRATQFELVDEKDNLLAVLGSGDSLPYFQLYDKNKLPRLVMCMDSDDKPKISLSDENGSPKIGLGESDFGTGVSIYDEQGNLSFLLLVTGDGSRTIQLFDSAGKSIWKQGVKADTEQAGSEGCSFE